MKRISLSLFVLLFFATFVSVPKASAQEVDYEQNAIEALKTSNVYVAPGTPGTSSSTLSELSSYLTPDDNIVLVMLPADAANDTDAQTIAKKISEGLSNQKTVGLAVGDLVVGYSQILPKGVASDQMIYARSVSNSSTTALFTFSRNIKIWLNQHPQPTPTPSPKPTPTPHPTMKPIKLPKIDTSKTSGKISVGFIALVVLVVAFWLGAKIIPWLRRYFKFTPATNLITNIEDLLQKVENERVITEQAKACKRANGLVNIYRSSAKYTGIGEDLFPVLLRNITIQLQALIDHEQGIQPIKRDQFEKTILILLNYDELFEALQENDPRTIELMSTTYMSENAMISHLGYLPTKK